MSLKYKVLAFDCFNTIFDVSTMPKGMLRAYADHVKSDADEEFHFDTPWFDLRAHPGTPEALQALMSAGVLCVAFSNGPPRLIEKISAQNGIHWGQIVDVRRSGKYKPHDEAYYYLVNSLDVDPRELAIVTANPTFGDLEGASLVGASSVVIRHEDGFADLQQLVVSLLGNETA